MGNFTFSLKIAMIGACCDTKNEFNSSLRDGHDKNQNNKYFKIF